MNEHRPAWTWLISSSAIATSLVLGCGPSSGAPGTTSIDTNGGSSTDHGTYTLGRGRIDAEFPFPQGGSTSSSSGSSGGSTSSSSGGSGSSSGGGSSSGSSSGSAYDGGAAGLAIHVSGNRLVDASNAPVVLHGADVSGTEFVCAQNYTTDPYGGSPLASVATFQAMRAWNINVIRLPLNEDCWLDINGVEVGGAAYQAAIEAEVTAAHAAGLFVILDLHWTAPAGHTALGQNPEPDADHSPAFWSSLASTFASDPGVIFDLFNEPFSYWGTDPDPWNGWLNGDTQTQYVTGGTPYSVAESWKTAGMQQLVSAVRAAGATQPILVNGLDWANDDSGWLTHAPVDPLQQIIVGAHIYPGESCDTASCWDGVFPAIGAKYPVLIGETGDSTAGPATFLPTFFPYADTQGWSYLGWTWNPWGDANDVLITDWTGTPNAGEGTAWKQHLTTFPFQN
jgi:endoglucanase